MLRQGTYDLFRGWGGVQECTGKVIFPAYGETDDFPHAGCSLQSMKPQALRAPHRSAPRVRVREGETSDSMQLTSSCFCFTTSCSSCMRACKQRTWQQFRLHVAWMCLSFLLSTSFTATASDLSLFYLFVYVIAHYIYKPQTLAWLHIFDDNRV